MGGRLRSGMDEKQLTEIEARASAADIPRLVAEVRRLRAEGATTIERLARLFDAANDDGVWHWHARRVAAHIRDQGTTF